MQKKTKSYLRKTICILCLFVGLQSFIRYSKPSATLLPELAYVDSLIWINPDSALRILDSMVIPLPSNKFQYATWCLLITQARYKTNQKNLSDSLINVAINYFEEHGDSLRMATALFYQGCIKESMGDLEKAISLYVWAKNISVNSIDYRLIYLINNHLGSIYLHLNLPNLALKANSLAFEYALKLKDSSYISNSLSYLGRNAAVYNYWDESVNYYKKAISIAESSNNLTTLKKACCEISAVYSQMNNLDSSIYYVEKILDLKMGTHIAVNPSSYLSLGHNYGLLGDYERSNTYLNQAIHNGDIYTRTSTYQVLYDLCKRQGKHEQVTKYADQYIIHRDSIEKIDRAERIAEIKRKYDKEKLINTNHQLKMEKARMTTVKLIFFTILIIIASTLVFIYQQKLLRKEINRVNVN